MILSEIKWSILFFIIVLVSTEAENSICGDWKSFKDEKCFEIFDDAGLKNYEDAVKICKSKESTLMTIHSYEEQDFVEKYLKENKIADNVWIGINYDNKTYKWADNTELWYKNWEQGSPKNKSDYCIQMVSEDDNFGKWAEVLCTKKNLVVCQKPQTWSLSHLQTLLLEALKNPVPIGFTYVQLPKERSPIEIWPWMIWKDVSSDYSGLFLRIAGSQASEFGKVQEENVPRIKEVDTIWTNDAAWNEVAKHKSPSDRNMTLPVGDRSLWIQSGSWDSAVAHRFMSFVTTGGEVRPRNIAIRIWRRMN